jgi:hypothetical protein
MMLRIDYETARYALSVNRFGDYHLTRKSDGASAYFQGDDADLWTYNMRALCRVHSLEVARDDHFDCLCSGYDDVLRGADTF